MRKPTKRTVPEVASCLRALKRQIARAKLPAAADRVLRTFYEELAALHMEVDFALDDKRKAIKALEDDLARIQQGAKCMKIGALALVEKVAGLEPKRYTAAIRAALLGVDAYEWACHPELAPKPKRRKRVV